MNGICVLLYETSVEVLKSNTQKNGEKVLLPNGMGVSSLSGLTSCYQAAVGSEFYI